MSVWYTVTIYYADGDSSHPCEWLEYTAEKAASAAVCAAVKEGDLDLGDAVKVTVDGVAYTVRSDVIAHVKKQQKEGGAS